MLQVLTGHILLFPGSGAAQQQICVLKICEVLAHFSRFTTQVHPSEGSMRGRDILRAVASWLDLFFSSVGFFQGISQN